MLKLVALVVLLAPLTAAAGDSSHEACVGYAALDTGGSLKKLRKIAVRYDEQRTGVTSRRTDLHASALGREYDGSEMSNGNASFPLRLANIADRTDVLFDGIVEVLQDGGLELAGTYRLDGKPARITAVLECTAI